jgi:hypothetical protein
MPLGIVIAMLAAAKKLRPSTESPALNMWWTHNPKLMMPVAAIPTTIGPWPTS